MGILKRRFFKIITYILLVVCSYYFAGGNNFLLYAASLRDRGQELRVWSQESGVKSDITAAEELTKEIEGLEALLLEEEKELTQPAKVRPLLFSPKAKENKLSKKEKNLDELDQKLQKEFQETEDFLRSRGLPEKIIQRHKEFVKTYEEKMKVLKGGFSRIKMVPNREKRQKEIKTLQEFIRENKPEPRHTPLDPNKLPHRRLKLEPREPRLGMLNSPQSMVNSPQTVNSLQVKIRRGK